MDFGIIAVWPFPGARAGHVTLNASRTRIFAIALLSAHGAPRTSLSGLWHCVDRSQDRLEIFSLSHDSRSYSCRTIASYSAGFSFAQRRLGNKRCPMLGFHFTNLLPPNFHA